MISVKAIKVYLLSTRTISYVWTVFKVFSPCIFVKLHMVTYTSLHALILACFVKHIFVCYIVLNVMQTCSSNEVLKVGSSWYLVCKTKLYPFCLLKSIHVRVCSIWYSCYLPLCNIYNSYQPVSRHSSQTLHSDRVNWSVRPSPVTTDHCRTAVTTNTWMNDILWGHPLSE